MSEANSFLLLYVLVLNGKNDFATSVTAQNYFTNNGKFEVFKISFVYVLGNLIRWIDEKIKLTILINPHS